MTLCPAGTPPGRGTLDSLPEVWGHWLGLGHHNSLPVRILPGAGGSIAACLASSWDSPKISVARFSLTPLITMFWNESWSTCCTEREAIKFCDQIVHLWSGLYNPYHYVYPTHPLYPHQPRRTLPRV